MKTYGVMQLQTAFSKLCYKLLTGITISDYEAHLLEIQNLCTDSWVQRGAFLTRDANLLVSSRHQLNKLLELENILSVVLECYQYSVQSYINPVNLKLK